MNCIILLLNFFTLFNNSNNSLSYLISKRQNLERFQCHDCHCVPGWCKNK